MSTKKSTNKKSAARKSAAKLKDLKPRKNPKAGLTVTGSSFRVNSSDVR